MNDIDHTSMNRVLVVDDDAMLIDEYLRCLGEDFEPDEAITTLTDLEKVLFGDETDDRGGAKFDVHSRNQGEAAVEAVEAAIAAGTPFSIVISESGDVFPFSGALPYENVRSIIEQALAS